MRYTIEQITDYELATKDVEFIEFMYLAGVHLSSINSFAFEWQHFDLKTYIEKGRFILCRRDGKPVGILLCRMYRAMLDPTKIILYQDLIYTFPNTRAAKLLMDDFIDFGKSQADHIITMTNPNTNIKPGSLEKLGFSKLETLYRLVT